MRGAAGSAERRREAALQADEADEDLMELRSLSPVFNTTAHGEFASMKRYLPILSAAMVMAFGMITICQAQDAGPSVEILSPKTEQIVHMGEQAVISWQVHNPPTPENHWRVYVLLLGCHEAMGAFQIFSAPLDKAPRQITWTPPQDTRRILGYVPDIRWYLVIQLYDETSGHDEELMMAQSCHPVPAGNWLVRAGSAEPVVRIEP